MADQAGASPFSNNDWRSFYTTVTSDSYTKGDESQKRKLLQGTTIIKRTPQEKQKSFTDDLINKPDVVQKKASSWFQRNPSKDVPPGGDASKKATSGGNFDWKAMVHPPPESDAQAAATGVSGTTTQPPQPTVKPTPPPRPVQQPAPAPARTQAPPAQASAPAQKPITLTTAGSQPDQSELEAQAVLYAQNQFFGTVASDAYQRATPDKKREMLGNLETMKAVPDADRKSLIDQYVNNNDKAKYVANNWISGNKEKVSNLYNEQKR